MAKKSIDYIKAYNQSYILAYRDKLEKKAEKKLLDYPENERDLMREELQNDVENRVSLKEEILQKKLEKEIVKRDRFEHRFEKRIWEVDLVRGIIIIGMLIDHFIGDFWMIFPMIIKDFYSIEFFNVMNRFSNQYWNHPVRVGFRLLGVALLLVLCGISAKFSRSSLKHSLIIIGFGLLLDVGFAIYSKIIGSESDYIIIGAILCIGICLLIYTLMRFIFYKIYKPAWKWISLGLAVAILTMWAFVSYNNATDRSNWWFYYNNYARCIPSIERISDINSSNFWGIIFGTTYFGSDWLGLFPYLGYMFLGGFLGEILYKENKPLIRADINELLNRKTRGLTYFGQHTLLFYIGHQPLYIAVVVIIALICGCQIAL